MKPRIVLHVGMPKAASSTLQHRLFDNRQSLSEQGYLYPETGPITPPKHQHLVSDLMTNTMDRLNGVLVQAGQGDLILSTEGLTNHLYDFPAPALAAFRQCVRAHDVTCIVIQRDRDRWIKSYYKQIITNPRIRNPGVAFYGTDIRLDAFRALPRIQALTDRAQLRADITAAYGADTVVTLDLEHDWMGGFDTALGLETSGWPAPARQNESPPDACIEILRQLNAHSLPEPERLRWKGLLQEFSGSNHTLLKAALQHEQGQVDAGLLDTVRPDQQDDLCLDTDTLAAFRDFVLRRKAA